jgi:S-adenosylmethionine:tRNA ribosyltransferase-isomerase
VIDHRHVCDLPEYLVPGDLMVFNQTRVLPARFEGTRAQTGGRVRGLYLQSPQADLWMVMLETRGRLRPGERITLTPKVTLELHQSLGSGQWLARLEAVPLPDTFSLLEQIGATPLPPYIVQERKVRHEPAATHDDAQRYNTIYASDPGSVAAPTAGLHFTPELFARIDHLGIARAMLTLHVGLGTFQPVRSPLVEDHPIHTERYHVPAPALQSLGRTRQHGRRVIVVGTTTARALESLPPGWESRDELTAETSLLICPGFTFRFTDALMTNFHLPRSSLMALVAALPGVGLENLKRWYAIAIAEGYRFYSYGDAMLLV